MFTAICFFLRLEGRLSEELFTTVLLVEMSMIAVTLWIVFG